MLLGVGQGSLEDNQPGRALELVRVLNTILAVLTDHTQYKLPTSGNSKSGLIYVVGPTVPSAEDLIELTLYLSF